MRRFVLATACLLLLPGAPPLATTPEPEPTPPGSPADLALWRAAGEVTQALQRQRLATNELQWSFRAARPDERLRAAARTAPPEEAARLDSLRQRLEAAWVKDYQLLVDRWPVDPTRVCQYPRLLLDSTLRAPEGPEKGALLAQARDEAQRCVDLARTVLAALSTSTRELQQLVAEAEKALPGSTTPPRGSTPAVPPASAPPAPPASQAKE